MTSWESFSGRHAAGDLITVTVTRALPFGCLVDAGDGVPGLLHGVTGPQPGERVSARIGALDPQRQRVSLASD